MESYPVTSAVNSAHGRLWMFEDLTLERDAREAIAAANHAKSNFLATMSHELRTPMTGMKYFSHNNNIMKGWETMNLLLLLFEPFHF